MSSNQINKDLLDNIKGKNSSLIDKYLIGKCFFNYFDIFMFLQNNQIGFTMNNIITQKVSICDILVQRVFN